LESQARCRAAAGGQYRCGSCPSGAARRIAIQQLHADSRLVRSRRLISVEQDCTTEINLQAGNLKCR